MEVSCSGPPLPIPLCLNLRHESQIDTGPGRNIPSIATVEELEPLDERELAELDSAYTPIPDFDDWPQTPTRGPLWDELAAALSDLRAEVTPEQLNRARDVTM